MLKAVDRRERNFTLPNNLTEIVPNVNEKLTHLIAKTNRSTHCANPKLLGPLPRKQQSRKVYGTGKPTREAARNGRPSWRAILRVA